MQQPLLRYPTTLWQNAALASTLWRHMLPHACMRQGCGGLVKPDIVFFGESLPQRFFQLVSQDFSRADLLIVMGTSLVVQPFASLIGA
jgi:NAD-dependent SIR2 family protein deacetylase